MVFSMFLLVKLFHFSVREMILLFIINNLIAFLMNPLIGRAIVRFGERRISSIEYAGVIIIFLVYAFSTSKLLVSLMYVIDSLLFNFAIAIRTYFQKVGDPQDVASSMAVGFTINHIAAVFLPALGGYLWMINYRIPFIVGAVLALISLAAAQFMRVPDLKLPARETPDLTAVDLD
jgi:MFS family permease